MIRDLALSTLLHHWNEWTDAIDVPRTLTVSAAGPQVLAWPGSLADVPAALLSLQGQADEHRMSGHDLWAPLEPDGKWRLTEFCLYLGPGYFTHCENFALLLLCEDTTGRGLWSQLSWLSACCTAWTLEFDSLTLSIRVTRWWWHKFVIPALGR